MCVWPDIEGIPNLIEYCGVAYGPVDVICSLFRTVTVAALVFGLVSMVCALHYYCKYKSVINH